MLYYATKSNLGEDTMEFSKKCDLANLKSEVDKLDINKLEKILTGLNSLKSKIDKLNIDKLKLAHVDLKKLSDVLDNDVVKKAEYD